MSGIKRTPADVALMLSAGSKPRTGRVISCAFCEKPHYRRPSSLTDRPMFCSRKCAGKGAVKSVTRVCEVCNSQFQRPPSQERHRGKGRFCSKACKGVYMSQAQRGGNNNQWKGGVSSESHRIRQSKRYKDWRKSVFERDSYSCQLCGVVGGYLEADHIKPFAFFPDYRFLLSNGRTLCRSCHKETDTYGYKAVQKYGVGNGGD